MTEPQCNGICLDASDFVEGVSGIAYPHPECELHSPQTAAQIEFEKDVYFRVMDSIRPQLVALDHMTLDLLAPQPTGKHRADDPLPSIQGASWAP